MTQTYQPADLTDHSLVDAIDGLQLLPNTAMVGALDEYRKALSSELSKRLSDARNNVWSARMELQRLENDVRVLEGRDMVELHGETGDVE